jgi:serine/threonine protein phosphatase PrpC
MKFDITHASEKGRRSYQEDRYVVYWMPTEGLQGYLLAVFDGHGGFEAADQCAKTLIEIWHTEAVDAPDTEIVMRNVFACLHDETSCMGSGCAASIAFIPEHGEEVIVGILGDAPVLVKNDGIWTSPEHNVRSNPAEVIAATARGGFIEGGYLFSSFSGSGLQMSRALGDVNLDKVLSREPEIFRLPTKAGDWVLVASDGLFDPSHATHPSVSIGALIDEGADARALVENALRVPTHDNVTAILVRLQAD